MSEQKAPLELSIGRSVTRQVYVLEAHFASWEELRRLTRQEFRALLRERLQEFGDKCPAVWDEKCGE